MNYFLNDHKIGFVLNRKMKDDINSVYRDMLGIHTFYKLWNVNNPGDRYICMLRHPYEIITSAYLFHRRCTEQWATKLDVGYYSWYLSQFPKQLTKQEQELVESTCFSKSGISYQDMLLNMSEEDGLIYEMEHVSRLTIQGMLEYDYFDAPNVHVVRFECLLDDFEGVVSNILDFLQIDGRQHNLLDTLCKHDVRRMDVGNMPHVTNKKLIRDRYKTVFTPKVYAHFKDVYPDDALEKLGYSSC